MCISYQSSCHQWQSWKNISWGFLWGTIFWRNTISCLTSWSNKKHDLNKIPWRWSSAHFVNFFGTGPFFGWHDIEVVVLLDCVSIRHLKILRPEKEEERKLRKYAFTPLSWPAKFIGIPLQRFCSCSLVFNFSSSTQLASLRRTNHTEADKKEYKRCCNKLLMTMTQQFTWTSTTLL